MDHLHFNSPSSSYSFTSATYLCSHCRRTFSQLKLNLAQAHCPRCNSIAQEVLDNFEPSQHMPIENDSRSSDHDAVFEPSHHMPIENDSHSSDHDSVFEPSDQVRGNSSGNPSPQFIQTSVPQSPTEENVSEEANTNENASHNNTNSFAQVLRDNLVIFFVGPFFFGVGFPVFIFGSDIDIDERIIEEFLRNDPNRHGPPPASQESVDKLQEATFNHNLIETTCCPICQQDYNENESLIRLPCKHDYHKGCATEWLLRHNACPICRQAI